MYDSWAQAKSPVWAEPDFCPVQEAQSSCPAQFGRSLIDNLSFTIFLLLFTGYNGPRRRFLRESLEKDESELHWFEAVCEDQNELIDEAVEIFNAEERELWIEK